MKKIKGWVINAVASWLGIKTLWKRAAGYRTKTAAIALLLAGISTLLGDLSAIQDAAGVVEMVKSIMSHPGTIEILAALTALGLRDAKKE